MRSLFCLLVYLLLSPCAYSSTQYFGLDSFAGSTSDDLDLSIFRIGIERHKNDLGWPYKNQTDENSWGLSGRALDSIAAGSKFKISEVRASGGWMLAENQQITADLGASYLVPENRSSQTRMIGELTYKLKWQNESLSGISVGRNHMSPRVMSLAGNPGNLYSTGAGLFTTWNIDDHWQAQVQTQFDFSEDRNQRFWFDGQIMYAFSKFPHWLRVGFGTNYLGYQFPTLEYWSPRRFSAYGPRADVSLQIFDQLNYFVGGSYNLFQENSFTPGDGYYLRTGLNWGSRDSKVISLAFENGESTQNGRLWYSHFYSLSASIFW